MANILFGVIIRPLKEVNEIKKIDITGIGFIRCKNCTIFLSPYCKYDRSFKTWFCGVCSA